MITVKATREGLQGTGHAKMASGLRVSDDLPFVALPSAAALRLWVRVRNPATNTTVTALVLDIGPWNIDDHAYVFGSGLVRPQAESGTDRFGRATNHAGIDLGERVWRALGMTDNTNVEWEFVV